MASLSELACIYAALALQDEGVEITADKIKALISAADINIEPIWPSLYAKALQGVDIKNLISSVGSGVGSAAAPAAAPIASVPDAAPAKESKKEEPKEESDDDMGFGLFD